MNMILPVPNYDNRNSNGFNVLKERLPGAHDLDISKLEIILPSKGIDVHRETAAKMFGVAYEDVTPEQRVAGKNRNYLTWWLQ